MHKIYFSLFPLPQHKGKPKKVPRHLGVLTQETVAPGKQFSRSASSSVLAGQKHGPHFAAKRQNRTVCSNSPLDCSWLRHRTPRQPPRVRRFHKVKRRRRSASRHRRKAILVGFSRSASKIAFPGVLRSFAVATGGKGPSGAFEQTVRFRAEKCRASSCAARARPTVLDG